MSQEDVEIVRQAFEAFSRTDLDAMVDVDPDVVFRPPATSEASKGACHMEATRHDGCCASRGTP
jgi:ketosteroid isomerase-like protein